QFLDFAAGNVGVGFIVRDHDFDWPAGDAPVLVDAIDCHFQNDQRRLAPGRPTAREGVGPPRLLRGPRARNPPPRSPAWQGSSEGAGRSVLARSAPAFTPHPTI